MKVLLLHAFPLDARMWEETSQALERAGYELAAPDLPGPARHASLAAWAERILADSEGELAPVGVSMGGYLAFELWRQAPERVGALVLADTRASADTPEARAGRNETIRVLEEGGFAPFWAGLQPKLFSPEADPQAVEHARRLAEDQPVPALTAALAALRDRPDSSQTLGTIDVPVLVVVGEEDTLTPPSDAETIARAIPQARLVRVPRSGHLVPLERPAEWQRELLAFLREVDA